MQNLPEVSDPTKKTVDVAMNSRQLESYILTQPIWYSKQNSKRFLIKKSYSNSKCYSRLTKERSMPLQRGRRLLLRPSWACTMPLVRPPILPNFSRLLWYVTLLTRSKSDEDSLELWTRRVNHNRWWCRIKLQSWKKSVPYRQKTPASKKRTLA